MWVFVLALLVAGCGGSAQDGAALPIDGGVDTGIDGAPTPDAATDAPTSPDVGTDAQTLPDTATSTDAPIDAPQDAPDAAWDTGVDSAMGAPIDGATCECESTAYTPIAQVVPMPPAGPAVPALAVCGGEVSQTSKATCYSGCTGKTADSCWSSLPAFWLDSKKTWECEFALDPHGIHNVITYTCVTCAKWKPPCH